MTQSFVITVANCRVADCGYIHTDAITNTLLKIAFVAKYITGHNLLWYFLVN